MAVSTFYSRHRITFTPAGGEAVVLLDLDQECEAEPMLTGQHPIDTAPLLGGVWANQRPAGGVTAHLDFDRYAEAATVWEAQAGGYDRWLYFLQNPAGKLRFETAFDNDLHPHVDWTFDAACEEPSMEELNGDTSPFTHAAGRHERYAFVLTAPVDNNRTTE